MKLLFAHGWGFDRQVWAAMLPLLGEFAGAADDRGYFGNPFEPDVTGPHIAVTHSFGTLRVLAEPRPGLAGIVAINGFDRFTAIPGRPGVPVRVVDRMLARFEREAEAVLRDFRHLVGCEAAFGAVDAGLLHADLLRLRDARPPLPPVPVLALSGGRDPLLPAAMREAAFAGGEVRRIESAEGGHLLPIENPSVCAQAVRGMVEALA